LQNAGMTLGEFRVICWWEWGHRQFGRLIGLVWGVGFLWFLARGMIPTGWTVRLLSLGVLGGLQGAIGWWMVSSGLTGTMLDVASYRLATHLGLAFFILGLIAWFTFELSRAPAELLRARRQRQAGLMTLSSIFVPLLFLQILLGALVAGIDAGRSYTDWPLMAGAFIPTAILDLTPVWANFFENPATTQFNHRMLAYALLVFGLFIGIRAAKSPLKMVRKWHARMGLVLIAQMVLGIVTVMTVAPWYFAIAHQFLAVVLFAVALRARFEAAYPAEESVRA
ncbi:MAG: COX15/CtaA family protein, partial [Pseudomonadota bacterium]